MGLRTLVAGLADRMSVRRVAQDARKRRPSVQRICFVIFLSLGYAILGLRTLLAGLADRMSVRRVAQDARERRPSVQRICSAVFCF